MRYIPTDTVPAIVVSGSGDANRDTAEGLAEAPLKFLGNTWVLCKPEIEGSGTMKASYMLVSIIVTS